MGRRRMIRPARILVPAGLALALLVAWRPAPALALDASDVRRQVAADYGVRVLKVKKGRVGSTDVFLVTVMNPGGDFNMAFQTNILAIDAGTGKRVSTFRHLKSGRHDNEAPSRAPNRQPTDSMRLGFSWR